MRYENKNKNTFWKYVNKIVITVSCMVGGGMPGTIRNN